MKKAFISDKDLRRILNEFETPFHLYDETGIRENARKVNKAFSFNKGFREYFAIKATPNPFIIEILKEEGFGVDCASVAELEMARALGFKGDEIMFSSNDTKKEEFQFANEIGGIINLDDFTHVELLKEALGSFPKKLSCRYNPGGTFKLSNGIMDNPGDAKYGMTKEQIINAYKLLKEGGTEELGIHAFLASNTLTDDYYASLAEDLFELAVELYKEHDIKLSFINLSGGVGVNYKPEDRANDILKIGENVKEVFDRVLVPNGLGDTMLCTEMGRYILAPYGHLVTTAINEKHIYKEYIGVDACACDLMRPAMYGAYHHITVLGKENEPHDYTYDVVGSLCENNDKFAIDRKLPKIEKGDVLIIHDTGAHGHSMGYNYNGKLRSKEVLFTSDKKGKLIRRAETLKDYFATLDIFDFDLPK